jgi:hypothetical protein
MVLSCGFALFYVRKNVKNERFFKTAMKTQKDAVGTPAILRFKNARRTKIIHHSSYIATCTCSS